MGKVTETMIIVMTHAYASELKQLKINFNRLQVLYQESLESAEKSEVDHKIELMKN